MPGTAPASFDIRSCVRSIGQNLRRLTEGMGFAQRMNSMSIRQILLRLKKCMDFTPSSDQSSQDEGAQSHWKKVAST